ncbi:MAG: response regulator [Chloroflexi bacterium]|nr:response regulator [Chloroflexota bacterium]
MLTVSPFDRSVRSPVPVDSRSRSRTLLIVDDDEGPREAMAIVFRNGYHVLMAENGYRALELVREHVVDVVILDIRMAGLSGIEVLSQLKKTDPTIEVIMLTAYETIETARQALRLGACDYLSKPLDLTTMRAAVANAIERRAVSNEIQLYNQRVLELQEEIRHQQMREEVARTQGEIYASIIHDINGPLTVIAGFVEVINQRLRNASRIEGEDLGLIKDRLARITRQVCNCLEISRRYLSFLSSGQTDPILVGVNQVLSDVEELLKVHPNAKGNELVIRPLAADVATGINGTDLIQILLNLTINALQSAAQPHRVEVQVRRLLEPLPLPELESGPHTLFLNRDGFQNQPPLLAVSVQDNGPGIPPEILGKVFDPYFTTKPSGQGTGLGLSIVQRLVQQCHGAIQVRSQPGHGADFTVYLPARTAEVAH